MLYFLELLYRFWKCAYDCLPISEKMEKLVYEKLWNAEHSSEEAYLARILKERSEDVIYSIEKFTLLKFSPQCILCMIKHWKISHLRE